MTLSRFYANSLPLLALGNLLAYFLLIKFFFEELCCTLRVVLTLDISKGCKIVAHCVLLLAESITKVLPQRDERGAHDPVRDDLVVVCLQKEEDNARR